MAWFDANNYDPVQGTGQLPVGKHPVVIKSSARVGAKDNQQNGMLVLTLEVIDGPSKGLSGPYRLNLWNSSAQAAEIAHKQLSAICHVVGVYQLSAQPDGVELFGRPFQVIVEPQTADPKYTQIVAVLDMAGNPPQRGQAPSAAVSSHQPGQTSQQPPAPSWGGSPQPPATQPPSPSWGAPAQQTAASWPSQPAPNGAAPANPMTTPQPSGGYPGGASAAQPPQPPAAPSWAQQPPAAAPPWANR